MKWTVRYVVRYPDRERHGQSECGDRERAMEWVKLHSGRKSMIARLEVLHGPKIVGTWIQNMNTGKLERNLHV